MADFGDRAAAVSDMYQRAALSGRPDAQAESLLNCVDCDDEIPAARREAVKGVCRCVDCQEGLEDGSH